jgi:galactokinase
LCPRSPGCLAPHFEATTPEQLRGGPAAPATDGVLRSRLTGAGFGGCTVSLVDAGGAEAIRDEVCSRYSATSGRTPRAWVSPAAAGAYAS